MFNAVDDLSQIETQLGHVSAFPGHLLFQLVLLQLQFRQLLIKRRKLLVLLEVAPPRTVALVWRFRSGFGVEGLLAWLWLRSSWRCCSRNAL